MGAAHGRYRSVYTRDPECGIGCNDSFVPRKRSGEWEVSDRLYEGNGVADGRFLIVCTVRSEKLYRLSENTL